jgi:hypothetical protein
MDHAGTEPTLTAGAQDAWVEPRVDDAGSLTRRAARVKRKHRKRENQAMITPAYVRTMAEYNAEMNRRLYGAAGGLSDAERTAAPSFIRSTARSPTSCGATLNG